VFRQVIDRFDVVLFGPVERLPPDEQDRTRIPDVVGVHGRRGHRHRPPTSESRRIDLLDPLGVSDLDFLVGTDEHVPLFVSAGGQLSGVVSRTELRQHAFEHPEPVLVDFDDSRRRVSLDEVGGRFQRHRRNLLD